ncbi:GFA family protein [Roseibium sp. M-1]
MNEPSDNALHLSSEQQDCRLTGTCFCGEVAIEVMGPPLEMGYCHCNSCRAYSGAPFTSYALFASGQVTLTRGAEFLGSFNKTGMSARFFCSRCGGHVMSEHPDAGLTDVYAAILEELPFRPSCHLNYSSSVVPVRDGLPKLRDFPAHAGGTGKTIME